MIHAYLKKETHFCGGEGWLPVSDCISKGRRCTYDPMWLGLPGYIPQTVLPSLTWGNMSYSEYSRTPRWRETTTPVSRRRGTKGRACTVSCHARGHAIRGRRGRGAVMYIALTIAGNRSYGEYAVSVPVMGSACTWKFQRLYLKTTNSFPLWCSHYSYILFRLFYQEDLSFLKPYHEF